MKNNNKDLVLFLAEGVRSRVTQLSRGFDVNCDGDEIGDSPESILEYTRELLDQIIDDATSKTVIGYKYPAIARQIKGEKDPLTLAMEIAIREKAEPIKPKSQVEIEQISKLIEQRAIDTNRYEVGN